MDKLLSGLILYTFGSVEKLFKGFGEENVSLLRGTCDSLGIPEQLVSISQGTKNVFTGKEKSFHSKTGYLEYVLLDNNVVCSLPRVRAIELTVLSIHPPTCPGRSRLGSQAS